MILRQLKMLKVQLVYFDLSTGYYPGFHHGLAFLAGALKEINCELVFSHLTNATDLKHAVRKIKQFKPDILGLSFTSTQKKYAREFLNKINFYRKLIVAGGIHVSLVKERAFEEFPELKGICLGESEIPFVKLCQAIQKHKNYLSTASFYFKVGKKIIKNQVNPLIDINQLPFPDYSIFNYQKIIRENGGNFHMLLSRGCPYSCFYCCNHVLRQLYPNIGSYVRFISPTRAIQLIQNNLRLYPQTRQIIFSDDTFTVNKAWLREFTKLYQEQIKLPYICNGRVETIDQEVIKLLKDSGCQSLEFGVESGSHWLRKHLLNRHHTNAAIIKAFSLAKKAGLRTFAYNIFALPFETPQMAQETFQLNRQIRPDFGKCFYFYPFPGTRLYEICQTYDLLDENYEQLSGYLQAPSLKETFMTHQTARAYFQKLQLFFFLRSVSQKTKIPLFLEKTLEFLILPCHPILYPLIAPAGLKRGIWQKISLEIRRRLLFIFR